MPAGRPMSRTSRAPASINCASASKTVRALRPGRHRQHGEIGIRGEGFGDARLVEWRRDHEEKIIGLGQGIEHMREFVKIEFVAASQPAENEAARPDRGE